MVSPIFMIGTQRSGSNLLRLMLNQLPEVASPHPPHILQRMMPIVEGIDVSHSATFAELVDDVCNLVECNPVKWDGCTLYRTKVASLCRERSLIAVFGAVYQMYAESQKADTWCCKSLDNVRYAAEIERYFPRPRYIYLYRDGRDVALSFRKAVVGEKHFYYIAKEWAETQRLALALEERTEVSRFLAISYEELTGDPEAASHKLCDFLGVQHRQTMLEFYASDEAKRAAVSSSLWNNVVNPVQKNNTRKFLSEASELDIRIFESVAGDVLSALGYPLIYSKPGCGMALRDCDIAAFSRENEWQKTQRSEDMDTEDRQRREVQRAFLADAKNRLLDLASGKRAA